MSISGREGARGGLESFMMSSGNFKWTTDHSPPKQFSLYSVYMPVSSVERNDWIYLMKYLLLLYRAF